MKTFVAFSLTTMILSANSNDTHITACHLNRPGSELVILKNIHDLDRQDVKDLYTFCVQELPHYTFITQVPFEHFQVYKFDDNNFVIEAALSSIKELMYVAHCPSLSDDNINLIKQTIEINSPDTHKLFAGDFLYNYPKLSLFDLCVKREIEISTENDSKGNKSAKGELTVSSDDNKTKASIEYEYRQNERGENETRAKASLKTEF